MGADWGGVYYRVGVLCISHRDKPTRWHFGTDKPSAARNICMKHNPPKGKKMKDHPFEGIEGRDCLRCGFPKSDMVHDEPHPNLGYVEFDRPIVKGGEMWTHAVGIRGMSEGKMKAQELSRIYHTDVRVYFDGKLVATYRNGSLVRTFDKGDQDA